MTWDSPSTASAYSTVQQCNDCRTLYGGEGAPYYETSEPLHKVCRLMYC